MTNPINASWSAPPPSRSTSISSPARNRSEAKPRSDNTWIGVSITTQPRTEGPMTTPTKISSTTDGSFKRGRKPSRSGTPKPTAATIARPPNDTCDTLSPQNDYAVTRSGRENRHQNADCRSVPDRCLHEAGRPELGAGRAELYRRQQQDVDQENDVKRQHAVNHTGSHIFRILARSKALRRGNDLQCTGQHAQAHQEERGVSYPSRREAVHDLRTDRYGGCQHDEHQHVRVLCDASVVMGDRVEYLLGESGLGMSVWHSRDVEHQIDVQHGHHEPDTEEKRD